MWDVIDFRKANASALGLADCCSSVHSGKYSSAVQQGPAQPPTPSPASSQKVPFNISAPPSPGSVDFSSFPRGVDHYILNPDSDTRCTIWILDVEGWERHLSRSSSKTETQPTASSVQRQQEVPTETTPRTRDPPSPPSINLKRPANTTPPRVTNSHNSSHALKREEEAAAKTKPSTHAAQGSQLRPTTHKPLSCLPAQQPQTSSPAHEHLRPEACGSQIRPPAQEPLPRPPSQATFARPAAPPPQPTPFDPPKKISRLFSLKKWKQKFNKS